jgi:glycosyltransferase involved in cell wall biosynthesis
MIVMFVHQNFPAQYRHLARHFAEQRGDRVYFLTQPNDGEIPGVTKIAYQRPPRETVGSHPLTYDLDQAVRTGAAAAALCRSLRDEGVRPDIIIGHSGWGETLFLKDVYPDVPLLAYFEFFYHSHGVDVDFDPEFTSVFSDPSRLRMRNAVNHVALDAADWGHTPTRWQRGLYPPEMRSRITAIHEGVDTDAVRPDGAASVRLARPNLTLTRDDEVITYVARNLEPYRGFHVFMRALPDILRRRKRAHVVIVGGDGVSYGHPAPPGTTYREMMLRELGDRIDLTRVHFLGQIPYGAYLDLLHISSVHVYLTYPFVLSWSFLEAMASGCLIVGSATPPVEEVLKDRENGLLVDFFSTRAIADRIDEALDHPDRMQRLRDAARKTAVAQFDLKRRQLPLWERLVGDLVEGRRPVLDTM